MTTENILDRFPPYETEDEGTFSEPVKIEYSPERKANRGARGILVRYRLDDSEEVISTVFEEISTHNAGSLEAEGKMTPEEVIIWLDALSEEAGE